MISFDKDNKQILSNFCLSCIDPYFSTRGSNTEKTGCCSYSPVFTLYEIHQMVKADDTAFFLNDIYHNDTNTVYPYEIKIHANVHPSYFTLQVANLTKIERDDTKVRHSTCQFFQPNRGCTLKPSYKNSVCRTFICSAIEDKLDTDRKKDLDAWSRTLQMESKYFHEYHKNVLLSKGKDLLANVDEIIDYLKMLS